MTTESSLHLLSSAEAAFDFYQQHGDTVFSSFLEQQANIQECHIFQDENLLKLICKNNDIDCLKIVWPYFTAPWVVMDGAVYAAAGAGALECLQYMEQTSGYQVGEQYLWYSAAWALKENHVHILDYFMPRLHADPAEMDQLMGQTFNYGHALSPDHPGREHLYQSLKPEHSMLASISAALEEYQVEWAKKLWLYLPTSDHKKTAIWNACLIFNEEMVQWMLVQANLTFEEKDWNEYSSVHLSSVVNFLKEQMSIIEKQQIKEATPVVSKSNTRRM